MRGRLALIAVVVACAPVPASGAEPHAEWPPSGTEVPVLLVPGWFDTERDLAALRIRLLGAGWDDDRVLALSFDDPTGDNFAHADEVARAVDALLERTGAQRVDIVAHSMGGLATRVYLKRSGGARVRRVVFMATPHHGTYLAYLAFGKGRDQMQPDSDFLRDLNRGGSVPDGIDVMTIRSRLDAVILPPESATLSDAEENREVCCPTHAGLLQSVDAFRLVRRFLVDGPDPDGRARP